MTTTVAVLTIPMPREVPFHPRTCHSFRRTRRLWFQSQSSRPVLSRFPPKPSSALASCSSLALSSAEEDDPSSSSTTADALVVQSQEIQDVSQTQSGCRTCGRDEIENGCNGEGRIQGGIATIPGFGWWPIKAYRPCPGFLASGGNYRRRGQSMDEVAFGGGERGTRGETLSSKKKLAPRKLKRYVFTLLKENAELEAR